MLVKDLLHQIEMKEITVQDIADHYNVTKRTIQNRIKNLGYRWNSKSSKYDYIGDGPEPLEFNFNDLFESKTKVNSNPLESKIAATSEQFDRETKALDKMKQEKLDTVDILLNKKQKKKRIYRGFYFDPDIVQIIDLANERQKSELINQALRIIFKEKGLL